MADDSKRNPIPGETLILLLFCGAAIAVVVLVGVLPQYREYTACENKIRSLQTRLQEQRILQPVFLEARKKAQSLRPEAPVVPERNRLKAERMPDLTDLFSRLARDCDIELVYAVPDAKSLEAGYKRILVKLLVQGPVTCYRDFILSVIALPYFDHLDQLEIERGTPAEELRLQFWLAID